MTQLNQNIAPIDVKLKEALREVGLSHENVRAVSLKLQRLGFKIEESITNCFLRTIKERPGFYGVWHAPTRIKICETDDPNFLLFLQRLDRDAVEKDEEENLEEQKKTAQIRLLIKLGRLKGTVLYSLKEIGYGKEIKLTTCHLLSGGEPDSHDIIDSESSVTVGTTNDINFLWRMTKPSRKNKSKITSGSERKAA